MLRKIFLSSFLFVFVLSAMAQGIIPKPVNVEMGHGEFTLKGKVQIYCSPEAADAAKYLMEKIENAIPLKKTEVTSRSGFRGERGDIRIYTDPGMGLPAEGYRLSVTPERVLIVGQDYGGVFNGVQTLLQLFPPLVYDPTGWFDTSISAPCAEVEDWPRFAYRGMHLDIARTFSDKPEVLRFIEVLAYHKINKFHWHLTDDEGWRVEIKSRPELAEVGGFRGGDSPVMPVYGKWDSKYGGYFTQEDIREVLEFARVRNIEVIPEVDLPGHSRTAARVYPGILCSGHHSTVHTGGYDMRNVWCVAKESNYEILDDVLREVSELFPSQYIHIGGDEVEMSQWMACPDCRALMEREGLKDGHELESHFMNRLVSILAKYGKSAAVWNEAINGGTMPGGIRVHGWENVEACLKSASEGYKTVVMPGKYFYLDMKYARHEPGMTWAGIVPTEMVYSFRFPELGFGPEHMENIVGVQGAFWAEIYINHDRNYLYRMTYPRICALAEVGWTAGEEREWEDFKLRLDESHYGRLAAMGVDYHKSLPLPEEVKLLRPGMTFKCSMNARASNPFEVLTEYRYGSTARTTRTCKEDDYLLFTFDKGVDCQQIEFTSGYAHLKRCLIPFGYAEVAYADDPETFVKYGDLRDGAIAVEPGRPVKALRIVSTTPRNGEASVIIQPLKIVAKQ